MLYTAPSGTTITGGTATYSSTLNFIPFSPSVEDLCSQVTCPIVAGTYNQSSSSTFPEVSGKIVLKIEWKDQTNNQLLCVQISTTA
jgi:hypothetical protein